MELGLTRREIGFHLVDCGDGALFADGVRLTAKGGWIHVTLPRDPSWLPEQVPLRVRIGVVGGEPGVWISCTDESVDLTTVRLAIIAALQSELMLRLIRKRGVASARRSRPDGRTA